MTIPFCEKDDMVRYMSLAGVIAFSDHEQTGEENDDVIDDCREQATDELIGQLLKLYEPAELAKSRLVTRWATVLACYYLCRTRGNPVPDSLHEAYDKLTMDGGTLAKVLDNQFYIPDIARRGVSVPTFSNMTIDRRYRREKVRVIRSISSDISSKLDQDFAPEVPSDR